MPTERSRQVRDALYELEKADPAERARRLGNAVEAVLNRCDWWQSGHWFTSDRIIEAIGQQVEVDHG